MAEDMMQSFTPGPWHACFATAGPILDGALLGWHITAPELGSSDPICERRDGFDRSRRTDDEERANARLIAAAPELYEALQGAVGLTQLLLSRDDLPRDVREVLQTSHRVEAARAALAKVSPQAAQPEGE